MMTDEIPQMIPNIVRKLRILLARNVATVWRNVSRKFMASLANALLFEQDCHPDRSGGTCFLLEAGPHTSVEALLQYHLVVFLERIVDQLRLGAVGNSNLDGNLAFALFALRIWHFHGGLFFLVVDQRTLRNLKDVLVFFQNHFGVGGHIGLELPAGV